MIGCRQNHDLGAVYLDAAVREQHVALDGVPRHGAVLEVHAINLQRAVAVDKDGATEQSRRVVGEATAGDEQQAALHAYRAALADERDEALAAVRVNARLVANYLKRRLVLGDDFRSVRARLVVAEVAVVEVRLRQSRREV